MMLYSKILNVLAKVNWFVYLCCLILEYFFLHMQNKVLSYITSIGILYFILSFPITIILMLVYLKKLRPKDMKGSLLDYMKSLLNFHFPENIIIIVLLCHFFLSAIIFQIDGVSAGFGYICFLSIGLIYNFCIINMTYVYINKNLQR